MPKRADETEEQWQERDRQEKEAAKQNSGGTPSGSADKGTGLKYRPDNKELGEFKYTSESSNIASKDELERIEGEMKKLGVTEKDMWKVGFDLALYCADNGSSEQTEMRDKGPTGLLREDLAAAIKNICTLRQFCMYNAKLVWNYKLKHDKPPINWMQWGFPREARFAAFDFFAGVTNDAAKTPEGGLKRLPTQAEAQANLMYKEVMVFRQSEKDGNQASNVGEITGGVIGPKARLGIKPGSINV